VLIELLFFASCYGCGATSEYRFKIGDYAPLGPVEPIFQVEKVASTNHSTFQKTIRLNDFAWYKNLDRSFFRFVTIHAFDRQTDGRKDRQMD